MYLEQTNLKQICNAIKSMQLTENEVLIILLAEDNAPDLKELQQNLLTLEVHFMGGLFPSLINGKKNCQQGVLLLRMPIVSSPILIQNLSKNEPIWPNISNLINKQQELSFLVLLDGLTENISTFLFNVYNTFGNAFNYFGGGAGSLSLVQQPCLFSNEGVFQDAALLCPIALNSQMGVRHGWESIYGPIIATKTEKNIVQELNWKPAFDVYKEVVEEYASKELTQENFFSIAKGFPFGMTKEQAENVVRDPIAVNEKGELICVGEVPENSILEILQGKNETLIEAAKSAAKDCLTEEIKVEQSLVFDCISRVLFLENDFEKELHAIEDAVRELTTTCNFEGALTLGEISSHGQGTLEFFNKTIVVSLLYE